MPTKQPKYKKYTQYQWLFYTRRAFIVLIAWIFIANITFFYEFLTLRENNALTSEYDFYQAFMANLIVGIAAGLAGGIITINLMERWLRKHAFWKALLYILITYTIAALLVSAIAGFYYYSEELGLPFTHPDVIFEMSGFFNKWIFIKNYILWGVIVIVTLIIFMINDKYGPGVFPDYLLGRYFQPKKENRIFMFVDIKDATTIAEMLGEKKYFNFLKDFFRDLAPAIVQTKGEVYQYIGDEVVISWKLKKGLRRANTLQCFFNMKNTIAYKAPRYLKKYGVAPTFKAGIHCGKVMVGELGQIKRDIVFSGDVLNTTARIAATCNQLDVDLLSSKHFLNCHKDIPKNIASLPLGNHTLKGKAEEVTLVTFQEL